MSRPLTACHPSTATAASTLIGVLRLKESEASELSNRGGEYALVVFRDRVIYGPVSQSGELVAEDQIRTRYFVGGEFVAWGDNLEYEVVALYVH